MLSREGKIEIEENIDIEQTTYVKYLHGLDGKVLKYVTEGGARGDIL